MEEVASSPAKLARPYQNLQMFTSSHSHIFTHLHTLSPSHLVSEYQKCSFTKTLVPESVLRYSFPPTSISSAVTTSFLFLFLPTSLPLGCPIIRQQHHLLISSTPCLTVSCLSVTDFDFPRNPERAHTLSEVTLYHDCCLSYFVLKKSQGCLYILLLSFVLCYNLGRSGNDLCSHCALPQRLCRPCLGRRAADFIYTHTTQISVTRCISLSGSSHHQEQAI